LTMKTAPNKTNNAAAARRASDPFFPPDALLDLALPLLIEASNTQTQDLSAINRMLPDRFVATTLR
jgi:hypothetical protein